MSKRCPALNCESPLIPNGRLMCRPHWKMVDPVLKRKMREAWMNIGGSVAMNHAKICGKVGRRAWHDLLKKYHEAEAAALQSILNKKVTSL